MGLLQDLSDKELRGFAKMLAEEMAPHVKPAFEEYMGPNGEQHKKDHQEWHAQREARALSEKDRTAERRSIRIGVTIALIMLAVNLVGGLFVYWVVTVKMVH